MHVSAAGRGLQRIHDRPVRAERTEQPAAESRRVAEHAHKTEHTQQHETAYARDVDVRRRLESSEAHEARHLSKEFKQLGKQLSREILAEARDQGLDPEQMKELKSILKDFRHSLKDTLRHDRGRAHEDVRPADALSVVESFTSAMEGLAADLVRFVGVPPIEAEPDAAVLPETAPAPQQPSIKPVPVEIAATA